MPRDEVISKIIDRLTSTKLWVTILVGIAVLFRSELDLTQEDIYALAGGGGVYTVIRGFLDSFKA